jgi:mycothiol synthase
MANLSNVDRGARGRRLSSALTTDSLFYLQERAFGDVLLYVEADNGAAIRVYR